MEKAERCALCGTAQWEWEQDKRAYEPVEKFCMGCYLKHLAEDDSGSLPGTTINLVPTKTREAAQRLVRLEARERGRSDTER